MIVRLLGLESGHWSEFIDVPRNAWYAQAVEAGIVNGIGGGRFAPDAEINRQEMTAIIVRAYEYLAGSSVVQQGRVPFSDIADIPLWALQSIQKAYQIGVIRGRSDQVFAPLDTATRAESAMIIHNLLIRIK